MRRATGTVSIPPPSDWSKSSNSTGPDGANLLRMGGGPMFDQNPALDRKVIVNLFSGNAIEGICTRVKPTYLIRAAILHEQNADPIPVDGEVSVDPVNVDFIQLLE